MSVTVKHLNVLPITILRAFLFTNLSSKVMVYLLNNLGQILNPRELNIIAKIYKVSSRE